MEEPVEALSLTNLRELRLCLHLEIACLGRQWEIRRPTTQHIVEVGNGPLQVKLASLRIELGACSLHENESAAVMVNVEKLVPPHPLAPSRLLPLPAAHSRMTVWW